MWPLLSPGEKFTFRLLGWHSMWDSNVYLHAIRWLVNTCTHMTNVYQHLLKKYLFSEKPRATRPFHLLQPCWAIFYERDLSGRFMVCFLSIHFYWIHLFFLLLIHQIRKQEADNSAMESTNNSTRMQLVTTESQVTTLEKENSNLRRDKDILTDHVADLQRQVRRNTHCSV